MYDCYSLVVMWLWLVLDNGLSYDGRVGRALSSYCVGCVFNPWCVLFFMIWYWVQSVSVVCFLFTLRTLLSVTWSILLGYVWSYASVDVGIVLCFAFGFDVCGSCIADYG